MGVYDELKARGMVAQATNEEKIADLLNNEKITFYIGFDPTADSLHVGHFLQLMVMARMQRAGHRPIAILGGGTAMVGDPTGRTDMRQIMTAETIEYNMSCFKKQMQGIVDFSDGNAVMVNNGEWLTKLNYIDFLRDIGVHFSVNRMLTAECFKARMERGLSFIEFNYMLMQSYDFLKLYQDYGCVIELGGDDQWSNILGGIELVRRVEGKEVYGLTFALLTRSDGKKMGKTSSGAVWLDPNKTTPYDFFQYWRNVDDADVIRFMKMLTFMSLDEIAEYEKLSGSQLNAAKEKLAYEVTKSVHGTEEAEKALAAAKAVFGAGASSADMPSTEIEESDFVDGQISLIDLLLKTGLFPSKSEVRRNIQQGGISIDDVKITDLNAVIQRDRFDGKGEVIVKKGKKVYHRISLKK